MNIQALNATSNLTRPRAPRSVSFGNNIAQETVEVAKDATKGMGAKFKQATTFLGDKFQSAKEASAPFREATKEYTKTFRKKGGEFYAQTKDFVKTNSKKAFKKVQQFAQDNKGPKGIKKVAIALTAVATGALAIKELHDIATGSNAPKA